MASEKLLHLQGLRGVAILAVVLFHFFPSQFSNGYIGVDIFFLLSGYLMTMMMSRYETVKFSEIGDFLYRRLKRIAPLYFLAIFLILAVLQLAPGAFKNANVNPAFNAILFITNLIRSDNLLNYFEKARERSSPKRKFQLGTATDLFTHTWSLSLEVQYYLFFPIIFIIFRQFSEEKNHFFLIFCSAISFLFYLFADDFTSFNSMFARIWQFNAGTLAFIYSNPTHSLEKSIETETLLEKDDFLRIKPTQPHSEVISLCLLILGALLCSQKLIEANFARMSSILLTMLIVKSGQGHFFLENKCLIFIGEISYGWYLFHWPIAAYCKLQEYSPHVFIGGLGTSFMVSVGIHFLFEKRYLSWGKPIIFSVVVILLAANLVILKETIVSLESFAQPLEAKIKPTNASIEIKIENAFLYKSDFISGASYGYEEKSKEEIIKMNEWYDATDQERLTSYCKSFIKTNVSKEHRCQLNEGANKNSTERLLVIGNSWASNLMPVIRDECQEHFSHLELSWSGTCEPLAPFGVKNTLDCSDDEEMYIGAVKEVQPDVLFIVARSFKMCNMSGISPFNDRIFQTAARRLDEIQKYVKRQIFILDAFPEFNFKFIAALNRHLADNEPFDYEGHATLGLKYATAKMRYSRLAAECQKCRLFDYTPQFFINGQFYLYDPQHFLSFISSSGHLNPPGQQRVRPILKRLCSMN